MRKQRSTGEADEGRIWHRDAHIARQPTCLCAVRLIRDDDDVVALAVGLLRIDVPVEFVDQAEKIPGILLQTNLQIVARRGPRRLVVGDARTDESPVYLAVEVFSVGHQQKREIAFQFPPHLLCKERHGVGLSAALGVPEHAEPSEIGMRPLDDVDRSFGNVGRRCLGYHPKFRYWLRRRP